MVGKAFVLAAFLSIVTKNLQKSKKGIPKAYKNVIIVNGEEAPFSDSVRQGPAP
jgi:hypothetical protein